MRLIDADRLKRQVEGRSWRAKEKFIELIDASATTIKCQTVQVSFGVKHGRWVQNDNGTYSCNLCQSWIPKEQHFYARFCLYCGAKMDAEEGEGYEQN